MTRDHTAPQMLHGQGRVHCTCGWFHLCGTVEIGEKLWKLHTSDNPPPDIGRCTKRKKL